MSTELPPLALQVELVYPDNTTVRWDADAPAKDQPTGISFKTKRYWGFDDAQLTLNRRIDIDYSDLGLLNGLNLISYDGSIAYEGQMKATPRSLQTTPQVAVQAQGWMAHGRKNPFVEVYVDRDLGKWRGPSTRRTAALIAAGTPGPWVLGSSSQLLDEAGHPAIELLLPSQWASPEHPLTEAWWLPVPGVSLGALYYSFAAYNPTRMEASDLKWKVEVGLSSDDNGTAADTTGDIHLVIKAGYVTATAARTAALLQLARVTETPGGAPGIMSRAVFEKLAVYGTHGLARQGEDPGGFYVSDIIKNIAQRWAPKLDTSLVQQTTFPVPHCSFLSDTFATDAFQTLNAYHRWEIAVYEDKRLEYRPIDLTDWDWEVRQDEPGTTFALQGDDAENLCNGVTVRYTDLDTGYETRLSPDNFPELRDLSPDNPANLNGEKAYTKLVLSVPTLKEGALQIGRAYLAEFNQAAAPGSITVQGYIKDRAEHWQPVWKVRAGDRLVIADMPNDSVRVVAETDYNHDSKTVSIAVDSSFKRLDAILARLGVAIEASGLQPPSI